MSDQSRSYCPVCSAEMAFNPRYPHAVCINCQKKAVDENGRSLKFFNESLSGGLIIQYADNSEVRKSEVCYINGVKCRVQDGYFGGIVIQVLNW